MQVNKRTLEIKILSEADAQKAAATQFLDAWESAEYSGEYLTFTSPASFFEVINARRWELVVKLQALGKTSIRSLAKQVERDVRRVHDDVKLLMTHGIIEQDDNGVCVPYETIHADFTLSAAA
ncbi:transcriptional regulator [Leucothrix pacifica]|uniref:HVO_A0114 family putative DNA-binding protein n=1 Tax=Leucothrix pacifica TaxID=1247513 RepID=UPI0015E8428B|nr:transcriptional regulator [Leucothrix pacifica]